MDEVAWLNEAEEQDWRALQSMNMRLQAAMARQMSEDSGISITDYVVLVSLTDQADGRLRLFELACRLGWEKSRLSHHISRMQTRGLLCKEQCDSDRRGAFVVVTDHGRQVLSAAAPGHLGAVRRYFIDVLTPEQRRSVGDAARDVLEALDAERPDPLDC